MITFCVIHTKRLKCTQRCLEAIARTTPKPYKVLLLIQGAQIKEAYDYFESLPSHIERIYADENMGALAGRKMLLKKMDEEGYGVIIDNDIYLHEGWFEPAVKALEQRERVLRAGIVLHDRKGRPRPSCSNVSIERGVFHDIIINPPYNRDLIVDSVLDGAFIFPAGSKDLIRYDPKYKVAFGGLDMSLSLIRRGYLCILSHKSHADHWHEPNPRYYRHFRYNAKEIAKSYRLFRKKWRVRLPFREHLMFGYIYPLVHTTPYEWWKRFAHRKD